MMRAESRTENPPFCSLNHYRVILLQTKSSAWWHTTTPTTHHPPHPPFPQPVPLSNRAPSLQGLASKHADKARYANYGDAPAQHQVPIGRTGLPVRSGGRRLVFAILGTEPLSQGLNGAELCSIGAGDGGDWCEQRGPTCGENKTAQPPALPSSFSDCDRGQGVKCSPGCPTRSCHGQHRQWVPPHLFLTVRMMSPTRFLSVCVCCLSVLTKHA